MRGRTLAPAGARSAAGGVTLRGAYRFFLPLVLMTELNMISKSVIHAFLARTAAPGIALAGFNVSFTFYYTLASATEVTTLLTISYLDSRRGSWRVLGFMALLLALPLAAALAVALTPLGDWLYGTVFGASRAVVHEAKLATLVFCASAPVLLLRGVAFGLLMVNRRTLFITWATLVRLLSLAVSLSVWPHVVSGAVIGAAALVTCMAVEAAFAWLLAQRLYRALPADTGALPGLATQWRFSWPLVLNQASEMGVVFVVNLFLGRLADPDLALAAFGVVHGLVSLMFSPMRNLVQTAQTLVASRADARVLLIFSLQLAGLFALLAAVLFHVPALRAWVLDDLMGLTPRLAAYCDAAMRFAFAMALFWALAALCRGLLAGVRSTAMLAVTGGLRIVTVALVGTAALFAAGVNGAVFGLLAWILAYAAETGALAWRLRRGAT